MDDYDIIDKLKLESISHKDIEFKAKNREKFSFKFKPDSKIYLSEFFYHPIMKMIHKKMLLNIIRMV